MDSILTILNSPGNESLTLILLSLAAFRIYLEIIGFNFNQLPLSKQLVRLHGQKQIKNWHRMGLIFSIGYLVFTIPGVLLS